MTSDVRPTATAEAPPPALIGPSEFVRLLNISKTTFDRMKVANRLPRHIVLAGKTHRWNRQEVLDWIAQGCPPREEWEARRKARR